MNSEIYSGNPNLKKANTNIQFTAEQIEEFIKCKNDPVYFCKKYVKIVSLDEGVVPFNLRKFQEKLIKRFHKHRFNICKMPRQCGKALALDTPIPTPDGWTTMGNLKVGNKILSPSGLPVSVVFKTETMYNHDCYKLYFDNGEEIVADADHLWEVNSSYWRTGKKVITSAEIFDRYQNKTNNIRGKGVKGTLYINKSNPCNFTKKNLNIDPYLLGVWLGDGYSRDGRIISNKEDYEYYKTKMNVEYERVDNNCIWFKIKELQSKLKFYNLLQNKHIPLDYLRSSYEDRLELLRGLMDTDGSVKRNTKSFEFYQKNYEFILQFVELLASLGIKSKIRCKKIKECYYHTVSFSTKECVFNLPRKINNINNSKSTRPHEQRHYIQKIEKVESVPVACIKVDSEDHLFLCGNTFIPTHNTTTVTSYLLHYVIFNDNVNIAILANKAQTAKEILGKLQLAYENLPKWLQHGVKIWNKASLELDNGSKILAASTSGSAVRGSAYNVLVLDEFAFVPNQIAEEFFASVYPTVTSGQKTKVIMISTPKGMNMFYKFWTKAERKENEYIPTEVHWSEVPGRDAKWKEQTIANTSKEQFEQEFECNFLGSVDTLITASKIKTLIFDNPITSNNGLDVYIEPKKDHTYLITVDSSEGIGKDYHAFIIFDVTKIPYSIAAKYKNNDLNPMLFADIIYKLATAYNKAYVLFEIASIGEQVSKELMFDLEYENVLMCSMRGRAGQMLTMNISGKRAQYGIKMSKQVKRIGCSNLKTIIEDDKLLIRDYDIISELTTFISKGNSYEAEVGCNDDLAMCLVIFAWVIVQDYFKDISNSDIRKKIHEETKDKLDDDMIPFGFISNGVDSIDDNEGFLEKNSGDYWLVADSNKNLPIESLEFDYNGNYNYF